MGNRTSAGSHNHDDGLLVKHYGVKGMHWGVRKSQAPATVPARTSAPKLSDDSKNVRSHLATIEKHGVGALSNKELQDVVSRMNLMQQYHNLTTPRESGGNPNPKSTVDNGHDAVKKVLGYYETYAKIHKAANSDSFKAIKNGFKAANTARKVYKTARGASKAGGHAAKFVVKQLMK